MRTMLRVLNAHHSTIYVTYSLQSLPTVNFQNASDPHDVFYCQLVQKRCFLHEILQILCSLTPSIAPHVVFLNTFLLSVLHSLYHPTFGTVAASKKRASADHTLLGYFVNARGNDKFRSPFNVRVLNSKNSLEWARAANAPPSCKIVRVLTNKASREGQGKSSIAREVETTI